MVINSSETETFPMTYLQAILDGKWILGPDYFKTKSEILSILNVSFKKQRSKFYDFSRFSMKGLRRPF